MNKVLTIAAIIDRAEGLGCTVDKRINSLMDIEIATELFNIDLTAWLNANDYNFLHDYYGIYDNIDRTEKSFGSYVPRFARLKEA